MVDKQGVSALMDGEYDDAGEGQLRHLAANDEMAECWGTYHLIGDVLRGEATTSGGLAARVSAALAAEPTVLAPRPVRSAPAARAWSLAAAVTVAGLVVGGWLAVGKLPGGVSGEAGPAASNTAPPSTAVARSAEADVDGYMLAHQDYSPNGAMRGVGSYIRTVASR